MNSATHRVRRATLDDLPKLINLWRRENLPWNELEKRFTEFQVAETADGAIVGAIGLQIGEHQGRMHSEAFDSYEHVDTVRGLFWERLRSVALNHGLYRVWTLERSPYWSRSVFEPASAEMLPKLPAAFGNPQGGPWLVTQLREEVAPPISLDKEFALFRDAERERTERLFQQARVMKVIATILALVLFVGLIGGAIYFFKVTQHQGRPGIEGR
jgi:N-acetylglutamate synthase-like GNAT family acetyltransferase